jgi:hypothetical protein
VKLPITIPACVARKELLHSPLQPLFFYEYKIEITLSQVVPTTALIKVPIKGYTIERCAIKIYRAWIKIKFTFYDSSLSKKHTAGGGDSYMKRSITTMEAFVRGVIIFSPRGRRTPPRLGSRRAENAAHGLFSPLRLLMVQTRTLLFIMAFDDLLLVMVNLPYYEHGSLERRSSRHYYASQICARSANLTG